MSKIKKIYSKTKEEIVSQINNKLRPLLECLSDGKYHSGTDLGHTLGLTRSGIWKLIQECRNLHIDIDSITHRGYRLKQPLTLLNKDKILSQLFAPFLQELQGIEIFDSLASTNDYLLQKARQETAGHWLCLAEHQSRGKGRLGRQWTSPFAKNLYLSLLWRFTMDPGELGGLALVTGLALAKTLEHYQIPDIKLKWPNDIIWQSKKLAGILIEFTAEAHDLANTVIGIGLNIDMPKDLDKDIAQPWVDLEQILQRRVDRNELVAYLVNQLIISFLLFQTEGLTPFISEWQKRDVTRNRKVTILTAKTSVQGESLGINSKGHFLVKLANKEILSFATGEVSLRVDVSSEVA